MRDREIDVIIRMIESCVSDCDYYDDTITLRKATVRSIIRHLRAEAREWQERYYRLCDEYRR